MSRFKEYARRGAAAAEVAIAVVPAFSWWSYAAARLGTFVMAYFATLATTSLGFLLAGVTVSLGAVIAIVPLAVFVAIRVSGALTAKMNKGE